MYNNYDCYEGSGLDPLEIQGEQVQAAYENYVEKQYDLHCEKCEKEFFEAIDNLDEYEGYEVND